MTVFRTDQARRAWDALQKVAGAQDAPATRLRDLAALRVELDNLIGDQVQATLDSGASWARVGSCLGVTKQAAQQRYGRRAPRVW